MRKHSQCSLAQPGTAARGSSASVAQIVSVMVRSPWVEANTDGSVAGSRPAAWQAASATSSATATDSGARRRSFGGSICGEGLFGADSGSVPSATNARAASHDGRPLLQ